MKFTGKSLCQEPQASSFMRKETSIQVFFCNFFWKILGTPFLLNTSGGCMYLMVKELACHSEHSKRNCLKTKKHDFVEAFVIMENLTFRKVHNVRDHLFSTYAKFLEKLTFLTPWYAHELVRIRGWEMLVFREILRTY